MPIGVGMRYTHTRTDSMGPRKEGFKGEKNGTLSVLAIGLLGQFCLFKVS